LCGVGIAGACCPLVDEAKGEQFLARTALVAMASSTGLQAALLSLYGGSRRLQGLLIWVVPPGEACGTAL